jgi:anti-anti-sigma regulatory factor
MEISHKELKRVDLVKVSGRVDSSNAPELEAIFRTINGSGRVMVSTLKNCKRYNRGDLRLTNMSERIGGVLEMAGLDVLFMTFPNAAEAVGSF